MAEKAYIGVNGVAQQAKKIYIGVNGVAREATKGYIGVNGVAQLFYKKEVQPSCAYDFRRALYSSSYANYVLTDYDGNPISYANSNNLFDGDDSTFCTINNVKNSSSTYDTFMYVFIDLGEEKTITGIHYKGYLPSSSTSANKVVYLNSYVTPFVIGEPWLNAPTDYQLQTLCEFTNSSSSAKQVDETKTLTTAKTARYLIMRLGFQGGGVSSSINAYSIDIITE